MTLPNRPHTRSRQIAQLKRRQGNILVAGILFAAAGLMFFGNIVVVSGVSWPAIGLMLITIGLLQLYLIWQLCRQARLAPWLLVVAFHGVFGIVALTDPAHHPVTMASVFFAGLAATGMLRCHCAYLLRHGGPAWRWLLAGGALTLAMAGLLTLQAPLYELSLAGQLLAIDLIGNGLAVICFSVKIDHARASAD